MQHNPRQRILILTVTESEQVIEEVLMAGARGFVLKTDAARDLTVAVEAQQQDPTFFNSRVGEMVLNGFLRGNGRASTKEISLPRLTAREREVVQLLAEGKSTKAVATVLDLSVKTTETHRSNIMRKLGLHCLSELVLRRSQPHCPDCGAGLGRPCRGRGANGHRIEHWNPVPLRRLRECGSKLSCVTPFFYRGPQTSFLLP